MLHRNFRLRRHPCHPWSRRPLRGKTGPRIKNQKVTFYKNLFFVKIFILRLLFFRYNDPLQSTAVSNLIKSYGILKYC
jgi:hypothetical protein